MARVSTFPDWKVCTAEHGNEGIRLLEKYVHPRDLEMQQACRHAIKQSADILCDWMLETWYFNTP